MNNHFRILNDLLGSKTMLEDMDHGSHRRISFKIKSIGHLIVYNLFIQVDMHVYTLFFFLR